jgi:hypothetical protein
MQVKKNVDFKVQVNVKKPKYQNAEIPQLIYVEF